MAIPSQIAEEQYGAMQDLQIQPANRTHISHRDLPINQKSITMLQDSNLHPMQRSNQLSIRRNGVRIYMKSMVLTIILMTCILLNFTGNTTSCNDSYPAAINLYNTGNFDSKLTALSIFQ